jgi:two-component system, chemotaxis family, protein-glutamate methylesterase/glutaminase
MLADEQMDSLKKSSSATEPPGFFIQASPSIVVIGGSAGGIQPLMAILSVLPSDFPFPILVVQHLSSKKVSQLASVIGRQTRLTVKWAEHGEVMKRGTVYLAPADYHLMLMSGERIRLSSGDKMGYWRPAVDVLFQSAAEIYGERMIAIVLSGMMRDGANGMGLIAQYGGITIAQDEITSEHFDMPAAAIDLGHADVVMHPLKIAEALLALANSQPEPSAPEMILESEFDMSVRQLPNGRIQS